jgi:hypothetical protein
MSVLSDLSDRLGEKSGDGKTVDHDDLLQKTEALVFDQKAVPVEADAE